jgi:hypothetical protein
MDIFALVMNEQDLNIPSVEVASGKFNVMSPRNA